MIDICVDEATNLCMQFNSKKCSVIRFGPRYHFQSSDVTMLGNSIVYNPLAPTNIGGIMHSLI